MSRHRAAICLAAACGVTLVGTAPSRADWLVTQDGSRLETKGPWNVKGKLVTFTLPNGTLGSLRLSEVDLARSSEATAAEVAAADAAKKAATEEIPAKPVAVLVLTDADVAHATEAVTSSTTADPEAAADKAPDTTTGAAVTVTAWDKSFSQTENGVTVTGTLRNKGATVAAALGVEVRLYDEEGKLVGSAPATLSTESLEPGAAARFRVTFPGVTSFMAAKFDVASTPISTEPPVEKEEPPPSR